jgi:uroporphyrinogen decarboxylase
MEFAPSVYEHAAKLIGRTPWTVSQHSDLLFQAHAEAFRLYRHNPIVVGIDIYNLEAEAYGAAVGEPEGNGIPAITGHPVSAAKDILRLKPLDPQRDGRLPMVVETGKRLAKAFPEADIRIPLSGPFSVASNLAGLDRVLCDLLDDPEGVSQVLHHLVSGQVAFCREIVRQGLDVAFFESAATPPLVSPRLFAAVELPALKRIIAEASAIVGHPVPCIIGGDTAPILDSILETGTGYVICPCETDQPSFMAKMKEHPQVMVRVNTRTGVFASGDLAALYGELDRIRGLVGNREKACIGSGALPFETDPRTVLKARQYVSSWKA